MKRTLQTLRVKSTDTYRVLPIEVGEALSRARSKQMGADDETLVKVVLYMPHTDARRFQSFMYAWIGLRVSTAHVGDCRSDRKSATTSETTQTERETTPEDAQPEPLFWTTKDVAEFLRCSEHTVHRHVRRGLPALQFSSRGAYMFEPDEVMAWIKAHRIDGRAEEEATP